MKTSDFNHYVGVLQPGGELRFVTGVDYSTKMATWGTGNPVKFNHSQAKEMAFALTVNGYNAMVCSSLVEYAHQEIKEEPQC